MGARRTETVMGCNPGHPSALSQIQFKPVGRLKIYGGLGLKHTGEKPHSQGLHRRLISLGNQAEIIINQAALPGEAVPVGSAWFECWLDALGLHYHGADLEPSTCPRYTHRQPDTDGSSTESSTGREPQQPP